MRDNRDRKSGNREFSGRTCSRSNSRKGNPPAGTVELTPSTSYHLLVGRHPAEGPFRQRIYLQALTKTPTIDHGYFGVLHVRCTLRSRPSPIERSCPLCAKL